MDLQELNRVVESFDNTGIGRCFALLATLAERGMVAMNPLETPENAAIPDDPMWSPAKAASHLDVSVATLRVYRRRYDMKSVGSGKARRYRKSEVERIIKIRTGTTS